MAMTRRTFLARTGAVGLGVAVSPALGGVFPSRAALAAPAAGYGPLVPDPAGMLDLPAGFRYTAFSRANEPGVRPSTDLLLGGTTIPGRHDGMGAFTDAQGRTVLVRNHELSQDPDPVPALARYDAGPAAGGCTTVVLGPDNRPVLEYASLGGTLTNCAGGVTPWGTWLSCEENETVPALGNGLQRRHGYVFEVDPLVTPPVTAAPVPLVALGRFRHEACAVDPVTGAVYQTEDAGGGHLYRFTPNRPLGGRGSLAAGGSLAAMDVPGLADLQTVLTAGARFPGVRWVPVTDPDAATTPVRQQVTATTIVKNEGAWWGPEGLLFVSSRGAQHAGQVWRYEPRESVLELLVVFPAEGLFDGPDNVTVSPHGGLFLCEDGSGDEQFVIGVSAAGVAYPFARNRINRSATPGQVDFSEFAGAVFAPDGRTLFVNIQEPGTTFAITGPFAQPAAVIPEAPSAALLGVTAAAALGAYAAVRARRSDLYGEELHAARADGSLYVD